MKRPVMQIISLIKKELLYGGLAKEEYRHARGLVYEANRKSIISHSLITLLFWAVAFIVYGSDEYESLMRIFPYAFAILILTLISGVYIVKKSPVFLRLVLFIMESLYLETGVACLIIFHGEEGKTVFAYVLAVIVPLMFIERTLYSVVMELIAIISYVILAYNTVPPTDFSWGLRSLTLFALTGILIGHNFNNGRFERYYYADSANKLAKLEQSYNAELQSEVQAKTERIEALNEQFIIGMATMVESRDNSTGGHIRRTSEGVRMLVEAIKEKAAWNLSDDFCEKIIKAAPMHDLGKIAVDDEVLRKPGRYTPEEFEKMKIHASEGARVVHEILKDTDDTEFRIIAENVAHYHHERVDGSGYPDGLKGNAIPLEARIMAIADVYDALVSKRVYKDSYSFERANQIILEGMGTQFDMNLKEYYEAARPKLEDYYSGQSYIV